MLQQALSLNLLLSLAAISLLGIVANSLGTIHIVRQFDVGKRTVFLLLLLDSIVSLLGCGATLICFVLIVKEEEEDRWYCTLLTYSVLLVPTVGYFLMMEISILRLHFVRLSRLNGQMDESDARRNCLLLLSIPLVYVFIFISVCNWRNIPFSLVMDVCKYGRNSKAVSPLLVSVGLSVPNLLLTPLVSLVSDCTTLCLLRKRRKRWKATDTVPVRATVLSAVMLLLPVMAYVIIKAAKLSRSDAVGISFVFSVTLAALRCPMATLVSFAYNKKIRRHDREDRLNRILMEAREEKEVRAKTKVDV